MVCVASVATDGSPGDLPEFVYDPRRAEHRRAAGAPARNAYFAIEGSEGFYGAEGTTTIVTSNDEHERPIDVVMRDVDGGGQLRTVTLTGDAAGRVLVELQWPPRLRPTWRTCSRECAGGTRTNIAAISAALAPAMALRSQSNTYDEVGRLIERTKEMGQLGKERTAWRYDDRGNRVAEIHEAMTRKMSAGSGAVKKTGETRCVQQHRFGYQYDAHGNWTGSWCGHSWTGWSDFQPANVERRFIVYFDR